MYCFIPIKSIKEISINFRFLNYNVCRDLKKKFAAKYTAFRGKIIKKRAIKLNNKKFQNKRKRSAKGLKTSGNKF